MRLSKFLFPKRYARKLASATSEICRLKSLREGNLSLMKEAQTVCSELYPTYFTSDKDKRLHDQWYAVMRRERDSASAIDLTVDRLLKKYPEAVRGEETSKNVGIL